MAGGVTVNKTAYRVAAKVAGQDPEMDRVAARVAAVASAEALRHKRSGELAGSIRVRRGRVDRVITIDDPEALHIEYGHLASGRGRGARWVPGLHILSKAVKRVG